MRLNRGTVDGVTVQSSQLSSLECAVSAHILLGHSPQLISRQQRRTVSAIQGTINTLCRKLRCDTRKDLIKKLFRSNMTRSDNIYRVPTGLMTCAEKSAVVPLKEVRVADVAVITMNISPCEAYVAASVAAGRTNEEIASALDIRQIDVEGLLKNVRKAYDVMTMSEAIEEMMLSGELWREAWRRPRATMPMYATGS